MHILVLDIRTLNMVNMSLSLLLACFLFFVGTKQNKFEGIKLIALGNACMGIGMLFFVFRSTLSDFITIFMANTLVILGLIIYQEGGRRFFGHTKQRGVFITTILILYISSFFYYTYQAPSISARVIIICLFSILFSMLLAINFLRYTKRSGLIASRIAGGMLIIFCCFEAMRLFFTLIEAPIHNFMKASFFHAYAYIFTIILTTFLPFCFFWIMSKELENDLRKLTNQDQLTGILNRRGFEYLAQNEFLKPNKIQNKLTVFMLDIDFFKRINDTYGHDAGDYVLTNFVSVISQNLRSSDIFARIGGEEFVIILSLRSQDQINILAQRLKNKIAETKFSTGKHKINMTISIGISTITSELETLQGLVLKADSALYASKRNGRNQVTWYESFSIET